MNRPRHGVAACAVALLTLAFTTGCPYDRYRPDTPKRALGHWGSARPTLDAKALGAKEVTGELLACDEESLLIATTYDGERTGVRPVRWKEIRSVYVALKHRRGVSVAAGGGAGFLSSISHGFLLIFSAPVWAVATIPSAFAQLRGRTFKMNRGHACGTLAAYTRFPGGMPEGAALSRLPVSGEGPLRPVPPPRPSPEPSPASMPAPAPEPVPATDLESRLRDELERLIAARAELLSGCNARYGYMGDTGAVFKLEPSGRVVDVHLTNAAVRGTSLDLCLVYELGRVVVTPFEGTELREVTLENVPGLGL